MKKLKKYYVIIFVMIMITTISLSASYAIFSNTKEEHGKLNIVAGTLNYKIESSSLDGNSILVSANTSKEIRIKLSSLNEVSSKYELYYVLEKANENVSVGYSKDTKDNVVGTIDANKSKVITVVIRNDSDTDSKVSFKVIGGLINNELALKDGNSLNQEVSLYCPSNPNIICISTSEELRNLATEVNNGDSKSGKTYYLINDLDLGGKFDASGNALEGNISWIPIGTESNPFSGIFDGRGHIVSNMYINTDEKAAMFGYINYGEVKNFGIVNSYIISKQNAAAGIVIEIHNGKISNSYNTSKISGTGTSAGIVSHLYSKSILENVYNTGSIDSNNGQFASGLVGYADGNSIISNSYNLGTVTGKREAGGIVGGLQGKVQNTYNLGIINSSETSGGVVGQLHANPIIQNSYNTGTVSSTSGGVVGIIYQTTTYSLENNYYLKGSASYGIGSLKSDTNASSLDKDKMPTVLSVINGDDAFMEDTTNINNGYPILKWQLK